MHSKGFFPILCALIAIGSPALGHMEMIEPYAIRSKYNPANKGSNDIDYSNTSPLLASGSNFPCKGYQNDRPIQIVATYKAGSQQTLKLAGSATHGGGSCQVSLSYDNGKTFRVIKSMIGGCPLTTTYQFTVPSYAPNGTALLAWTWQNKIGNREYYMNCAEVNVESDVSSPAPSSSSHRRRGHPHQRFHKRGETYSSFNELPFIWQANMPDQNTCVTTEGEEPVYPDPGPDVQYADGLSASSPKAPGTNCDSPTPPGQTYKDLSSSGGTDEQASYSSDAASSPTSSATLSTVPTYSASSSSPVSGGGTNKTPSGLVPISASTPPKTSSVAPYTPPSNPGGSSGSSGNNTAGTMFGTCTSPGQMQCLNGGQAFAICDNGVWMNMGSVAAGTVCEGQGQIVAAGNS